MSRRRSLITRSRAAATVLSWLVLLMLVAGCTVQTPAPVPLPSAAPGRSAPPAPASAPPEPQAAGGFPFKLILLHTNDTWGYLLPCG